MLCGGIWDLLWRREIDVNWERNKENTESGNEEKDKMEGRSDGKKETIKD